VSFDRSDDARRDIFERIRRARRTDDDAQAREQIEARLREHPRGPLRSLSGDTLERFLGNLSAQQSTWARVRGTSAVPESVAAYLRSADLPSRGAVSPALAHHDWSGAGLALEPRAAVGDDPVGVTGVFAAIAETGTLMLVSGEATPPTNSLLPETHVAVVHASQVVAFMEEAWDRARQAFGELPRAVNFVSGPSRTGDIEQKMVLGAHGPYRVHVVLVEET
jgi:L-lactate dehydrogenase complex protein LldG